MPRILSLAACGDRDSSLADRDTAPVIEKHLKQAGKIQAELGDATS